MNLSVNDNVYETVMRPVQIKWEQFTMQANIKKYSSKPEKKNPAFKIRKAGIINETMPVTGQTTLKYDVLQFQ